MNVAHILEEVEREANVDGRAANEFVECVIIELLNEVAYEDTV